MQADNSALPEDARPFLSEWLGAEWEARALPGDASVRGYFRIAAPNGRRYMLCYYPPEVREQAGRFLRAYDAISGSVRVPAVLRHVPWAVAQEDVGDRTLYDLLHADRARGVALYRRAVDLLVEFQRAPAAARDLNPPFEARVFEAELEMALEYYVQGLMGRREGFEELFTKIATTVAHHPFVLTHRDYHGQNIHIFNDQLYIIDYQDLRMGPDTYDLASLLRDRGVARILGRDVEEALVAHYAGRAGGGPELRRRYFETLLQRSIKILGTFARQALTRGRRHYLDFIPPTLESIRVCVAELPEYGELLATFPLDYRTN